MQDNYEDIINLEHPVSKMHPRMSMLARAAQFSPFAALTGYDAAIREEGRQTDRQRAIDDDSAERLDRRMAYIREHLAERPTATITYFAPDEHKAGGQYRAVTGRIKKIDDFEQTILLEDNLQISLRYVLDIDSELFEED